MSLSRALSPRILVLTSIVCCGTVAVTTTQTRPHCRRGRRILGRRLEQQRHFEHLVRWQEFNDEHYQRHGNTPSDASVPDAGDGALATDAGDGDATENDGSVDAAAGIDEPAPHDAILVGTLSPIVATEAGTNPSGRVQLQSLSSGQTIVTLQAIGLDPNTTYGAHVHAFPCQYDNGGRHHKIDPASPQRKPTTNCGPASPPTKSALVTGESLSITACGGTRCRSSSTLPT